MNTIRKVLVITILAFLSLASVSDQSQNPHWRTDACDACHVAALPTAESHLLKTTPGGDRCLGCHTVASGSACQHQSTIPATPDMQARMPESFRVTLDDDQVVCETCHDLPAQCLDTRRNERRANPMFLREGPFRQRSDSCYLCHHESAYTKLDPHNQFTEQGIRRDVVCLLCHTTIDSTDNEDVDYLIFNIGDDLSAMCAGCHPERPHPGATFTFSTEKSSDHMVVPSRAMLRRMEKKAAASGARLPLEPSTGKIFCATCHNPHDKSLPDYPVAPSDAGDPHRLRLKDICIACHDK